MKYWLTRLVRLKPFDESAETPRAGTIYANSVFFTIAIGASAFLAVTAFALALAGAKHAQEVLAGAVGLSAVTAGVEWHAGLKARALNQLFTVVLAAFLFAILSA